MTIKVFFTLMFAATATSVFGQSLKLENLTVSDKNSKTVYIALDNLFSIRDAKHVTGTVPQDGVALDNNQLRIRANVVGKLPVAFLTTGGKEVITFEARTVPSPVVAIGKWTRAVITKERLLNQGVVSLTTFKNEDSYFEGYQITFFEVQLNGQTFSIKGNTFSSEVLAAIQKAKTGDVLTITHVTAINEALQKKFDFAPTTTFKVQ